MRTQFKFTQGLILHTGVYLHTEVSLHACISGACELDFRRFNNWINTSILRIFERQITTC